MFNITIIKLNSDAHAEKSEKNVLRTRLTSKTFPAVLGNIDSGTLGKHNISSVFPVSPQASLASGFARDTKGQGGKLRIRSMSVLNYFFHTDQEYLHYFPLNLQL